MTRADLYREYARVIEMCDAAHLPADKVKTAIRLDGLDLSAHDFEELYQLLHQCAVERFSFALGILENKPVFAGDILYSYESKLRVVEAVSGGELLCDRVDTPARNIVYPHYALSWNPPVKQARKMSWYLDYKKIFETFVKLGQTVGFDPGQGDIDFTFHWKR